jgi:hypothetical protein
MSRKKISNALLTMLDGLLGVALLIWFYAESLGRAMYDRRMVIKKVSKVLSFVIGYTLLIASTIGGGYIVFVLERTPIITDIGTGPIDTTIFIVGTIDAFLAAVLIYRIARFLCSCNRRMTYALTILISAAAVTITSTKMPFVAIGFLAFVTVISVLQGCSWLIRVMRQSHKTKLSPRSRRQATT